MPNLFGFETPVGQNNDGTPYTLGTIWSSSVPGTVDKIRWRCPVVPPDGDTGFGLYNNDTGVLLQSTTQSLASFSDQWVEVALPSPVSIVAGVLHTAVIFTANRYVATNAYPWPKVSGVLSTPNSAGRYDGNFSMTRPVNISGDGNYFVDVNFIPLAGGPVVTVWDGSAEVPATIGVWNGTAEVPGTIEIV